MQDLRLGNMSLPRNRGTPDRGPPRARRSDAEAEDEGGEDLAIETELPTVGPRFAGEPARPETCELLGDWRDARTRRHDELLEGAWYRCKEHGLSDRAHLVASYWYCAADSCGRHVIQVGAEGRKQRQSRVLREVTAPVGAPAATASRPPRPLRPLHEDRPAGPVAFAAPSAKPTRRPRYDDGEEDVMDGEGSRAPRRTRRGASPGWHDRRSPEERAKGPPGSTIVLIALRAAPTRTLSLQEILKFIRAGRPDLDTRSQYAAVYQLAKRGLVERRPDQTVALTDAGAAHAQLEAAHGSVVDQIRPESLTSGPGRGSAEPAESALDQKSATQPSSGPRLEREGSPPPAPRRRRGSRPRPAAPDAAPTPPASTGVPSEPGPEVPAPDTRPTSAGVVLVRAALEAVECEICTGRIPRGEEHVVIVVPDLEVPVCDECAATGDDAMRAAAAPLLLARLCRRRKTTWGKAAAVRRRAGRRRAS